jgi:tight adherence protein C
MSGLLVFAALAGGLAVAAGVLAFTSASTGAIGVARSLELLDQMRRPQDVALHELPARQRFLDPVLRLGLRLGRRLTPAGVQASLQHRLDLAGNPGSWTPDRVLAAKGAVGGLVLVLGGLLFLAVGGFWGIVWVAALTSAAFWLPDLLVYNAALHRQTDLRKSTPDALDMLTVCVEAGLGFDAALSQVARNAKGPIAGECARILQEMQIGKTRVEAFHGLAERTTVAELKTLVTALVQADRLGIPVGTVLREQAREMRVKRRQRAEEQAQKVPVKILFPLIFCIFPALFVVVIGPGVIQMIGAFSGR